MTYQVIDKYKLKDDTAIIISGSGEGLKIGCMINGGKYKVLSIGMMNVRNPEDLLKNTPLVIEGDFDDEEVYV